MKVGEIKKQLSIVIKAVEFLLSLDDEHELSFIDLIKVSALFSPQRRTSILEKHLKALNKWKVSPAKHDKGDYIDVNGKFFELKTSATNANGVINIDQVRIWQSVDYYVVVYWNLEEPEKSKKYVLTKEQMTEEVEKLGSASHGTKSANKQNQNIEYSIHLSIDNEWDKKYKVKFEELDT